MENLRDMMYGASVTIVIISPDLNKLVLGFVRKLEDKSLNLERGCDQMFYFVRSEMECYAGMEKLAQAIERDEDWRPEMFEETDYELIDEV